MHRRFFPPNFGSRHVGNSVAASPFLGPITLSSHAPRPVRACGPTSAALSSHLEGIMPTWNEAIEGYWLAKRQNMSKNTVIDYARTFRRFGDWIDQGEVEKVKPQDVQAFLLHLKEEGGLAPKTVSNSWIALSSLWTWLHAELQIKHIMKSVDKPKFRRKSPEPFTEKEVKRLLFACHAMKAYDPVHDCYVEGLRPTAARDYAIMVVLVATGHPRQRTLRSERGRLRQKAGEVGGAPWQRRQDAHSIS